MVGIQEAWGKHRAAREGGGLEILRPRQHIISRFPLLEAPDSKGLYTFIEVLPGTMVAMANMHLPDDPMGRTWSDRVPRRRRWKKINGRFACQRPCLRRKTVRSCKRRRPRLPHRRFQFSLPSRLDETDGRRAAKPSLRRGMACHQVHPREGTEISSTWTSFTPRANPRFSKALS